MLPIRKRTHNTKGRGYYESILDRTGQCRNRNAPDAEAFGDEGSNTWKTCYDSGKLHIPNMEKLGIYNIDEMNYGDKSLSQLDVTEDFMKNLWEKIRPSGIGRWQV